MLVFYLFHTMIKTNSDHNEDYQDDLEKFKWKMYAIFTIP
jgi:hypothetical protein